MLEYYPTKDNVEVHNGVENGTKTEVVQELGNEVQVQCEAVEIKKHARGLFDHEQE